MSNLARLLTLTTLTTLTTLLYRLETPIARRCEESAIGVLRQLDKVVNMIKVVNNSRQTPC